MPNLRNSPASETVMTFTTWALSAAADDEEYVILLPLFCLNLQQC